jgi:DNA invertase Pin-like site-specific DNA recombinase
MNATQTTASAVAYLRVSTEEQHLGPEAQLAAVRSFAAARGIEIVAVFTDRVSGAAPLEQREGLMDALRALEDGEATVLIAAKRDRLARDTMLAAMLERQVEKLGGTILTADGVAEGDAPEAVLMRRILDAFSEYERAMIRARTRAAMRALKARGVKVGKRAYGETAEERETIAAAAALRAQGLTLHQVSAQLAARGHLARNGRPFSVSTLHSILNIAAIAA